MRWPEQGLLSSQALAHACPNLAIRDFDMFVSLSEYSLNAKCKFIRIADHELLLGEFGSFGTPPEGTPARRGGELRVRGW